MPRQQPGRRPSTALRPRSHRVVAMGQQMSSCCVDDIGSSRPRPPSHHKKVSFADESWSDEENRRSDGRAQSRRRGRAAGSDVWESHLARHSSKLR
eukprot:COSAG01_NODE_4488_length_4979_cov_4.046293_7_plen_96_part_00